MNEDIKLDGRSTTNVPVIVARPLDTLPHVAPRSSNPMMISGPVGWGTSDVLFSMGASPLADISRSMEGSPWPPWRRRETDELGAFPRHAQDR